MTYAEETMENVKEFLTTSLVADNCTMYQDGNRIFLINRTMARTWFEEFWMDEEKGLLIMRVHLGLHCFRSFRTSCLDFISNMLEELRRDGFYVEVLMDSNGEVYCQKAQYVRTEAASKETIEKMYFNILKVAVEHDTELQVAMMGLDSNDVYRNLMVEEEKELLVKEIRKKMRDTEETGMLVKWDGRTRKTKSGRKR